MRLFLIIGAMAIGGCTVPAMVERAPAPLTGCTPGDWCPEQSAIPADIQASYEAMSVAASSRPASIDPFEDALHVDFTRTGDGGSVAPRGGYLNGMGGWYAEGNHVASEQEELMDVRRSGDTVLIRRRISEQMADKDGNPIGAFDGVVTDVWVREDGRWWLFTRDVATAEE